MPNTTAGRNTPNAQGKQKPKGAHKGRHKQAPGDANISRRNIMVARKVTPDDEYNISERYATGKFSMPELAKEYDVSNTLVWQIVHRHRPDVFIENQLADVGIMQDKLLRTIGKALDRVAETIKDASPQQAAVTVGILTDKYLLLTGNATRRIEPTVGRPNASGPDGERAEAIEAIKGIGNSLRRIAKGGASAEGGPGQGGPGRVHGIDIPGPGDRGPIEAAVVSSGVAKGDDEPPTASSDSTPGPREDNPSTSGPDVVGTGKESEPTN